MTETLELILAVVSGIATAIPLVIQLTKWIQKAIKERNWNKLLDLIMSYMATAEKMFDDGATKKQWVMEMIQKSAESIDYDIDMDTVSALIDNLCKMSRKVNPPASEKAHGGGDD